MATITSSILSLLAASEAPEVPEPETIPVPAVAFASTSDDSSTSVTSFERTTLGAKAKTEEPETEPDTAEPEGDELDGDDEDIPRGVGIDRYGAIPTVQMKNMAGMPIPTTRPTAFPQRPPIGLFANTFTRRGRMSARGGGPTPTGEWAFDFHGYLRAPARVGWGRRAGPDEPRGPQAEGQDEFSVHLPLIPDDQYLSYQYTQHNARDWAELYLSYGNGIVTGTTSIQGFNFTDANWRELGTQFGIAQAYVTLTPKLKARWLRLLWKVGSFDNRYGASGRYDAGELETYLFGRTHLMGESLGFDFLIKDWTVSLEHGIGAVRPDPQATGNFARFTVVNHAHLGFAYQNKLEFNVHYLNAFANEADRVGTAQIADSLGLADGQKHIVGPELRVDWGKAGYWYLGYSYIKLIDARTISRGIEVIHSLGAGQFTFGLIDNYTGSQNGEIHSVIGQVEHSIQKALKGDKWYGQGRDLTLKVYFMINKIGSESDAANGDLKAKVGTDLLFSALPWLGIATRFTHVAPDDDFPEQTFQVLSPRIVFRTNFITHETIEFQYSRYFYAERICPPGNSSRLLCVQPPSAPVPPEGWGALTGTQEDGVRAAPITEGEMNNTRRFFAPDQNVFLMKVSMWW